MPTCTKCNNDVKKVYDCDHTNFEEYCVECYTELHYYLTERWTQTIAIISLNPEFFCREIWVNWRSPSPIEWSYLIIILSHYSLVNKLVIPAILAATVMVAGMFAFMPVNEASTVHTSGSVTLAAGQGGSVKTATIEDTDWDTQAQTGSDAAKRLTCTAQATISEIAFDIDGGTVAAGTNIDLVVDIDGSTASHDEITFSDIFSTNVPADELAVLASLGLNQGVSLDDDGFLELVLVVDTDTNDEDVNITVFYSSDGTCSFTSVAP